MRVHLARRTDLGAKLYPGLRNGLVSGSILAHLNRALHATVLLGLLVGLFDFVMLFIQMAFPRTELGWVPDLVILAVVTLAITILGSRPAAATSSP